MLTLAVNGQSLQALAPRLGSGAGRVGGGRWVRRLWLS